MISLMQNKRKINNGMGKPRSCFHLTTLALQARVEYVNRGAMVYTTETRMQQNYLRIVLYFAVM